MRAVRPILEAVDGIGEAGGGFGEVRCVDLFDVSEADDLGARSRAGDQRFHLLRGEVLRFIENQPAGEKRAAAHEVQRADLDPRGQQIIGRGAAPAAAVLGVGHQHFKVVGQRPHPRRHFFFFGAGQETDVLADAHRRAGHDDFAIALLVHRLRQTGRQREQGFAGAGGAEQGDKIDLRIHQRIDREVLFAIARGDAPHRMLMGAVIIDDLQFDESVVDFGDTEFGFVVARQIHELVRIPVVAIDPIDFVIRAAFFGPRLQPFAVTLPEILGQCAGAGVQHAEIVQRAVVLVVLGRYTRNRALDAQIDVLRNKHHRHLGLRFAQCEDRAENMVVRNDRPEALACVETLGLEAQLANAVGRAQLQALRLRQREARCDLVAAVGLDEFIDEPTDLTRIATGFGSAFFGVVQFFDDLHRQKDVVFFEFEQRGGVVHQHIGV